MPLQGKAIYVVNQQNAEFLTNGGIFSTAYKTNDAFRSISVKLPKNFKKIDEEFSRRIPRGTFNTINSKKLSKKAIRQITGLSEGSEVCLIKGDKISDAVAREFVELGELPRRCEVRMKI